LRRRPEGKAGAAAPWPAAESSRTHPKQGLRPTKREISCTRRERGTRRSSQRGRMESTVAQGRRRRGRRTAVLGAPPCGSCGRDEAKMERGAREERAGARLRLKRGQGAGRAIPRRVTWARAAVAADARCGCGKKGAALTCGPGRQRLKEEREARRLQQGCARLGPAWSWAVAGAAVPPELGRPRKENGRRVRKRGERASRPK